MSTRRRRHRLAISAAISTLMVAIVSIAPAGALASWTIVPSPNHSTGTNVLAGVACRPGGSCTAVGYAYDTGLGAFRTLIESGNSSSWSIVPSPNTGPGDNMLAGVSCATATSCKAAGFSTDADGVNHTLIETWSGAGWSIEASPDRGAAYNVLNSVSCRPATGSCTAVGYAYDANLGATRTLVESWNGTSWSIVPSPNHGSLSNYLSSVSCYGPRSCTAVGYDNTIRSTTQTLVESWNGTTWSVVPSRNIGTSADLLGVSCRSSSTCQAVGSYETARRGASQTLVESWDGSSWSVVRSPNTGTGVNDLIGISCAAAGACQAVGLSFDTSLGDYRTLIESWTGGRWSVVASPNIGAAYNVLAAVSCRPAAASCKAVGNYFDASISDYQTLVESNG